MDIFVASGFTVKNFCEAAKARRNSTAKDGSTLVTAGFRRLAPAASNRIFVTPPAGRIAVHHHPLIVHARITIRLLFGQNDIQHLQQLMAPGEMPVLPMIPGAGRPLPPVILTVKVAATLCLPAGYFMVYSQP